MPPLRKRSANTDPHAIRHRMRGGRDASPRPRRPPLEAGEPNQRIPQSGGQRISRRHRWLSRTGSAPEKRGGHHGRQREDCACVNSHIAYRSSSVVLGHRVGTKRTRRTLGDGPSDRRRLRQRPHSTEPSGCLPGASCGRNHVPYQPPGLDRRLHG
jgi:hypothetical protein